MSHHQNDEEEVINFTPKPAFTIESLASTVIQMMRELDMDACINLPDNVVLEIDKECTAKEIIAGYKKFIARKLKSSMPSNKNEKS
ncbi:MAG: hypothetical protein KAI76_05280 [Alphaproteobacteria bacterium]|nr:hypothetical protein [Alphaproteobacteria bacterium]